MNPFFLRIFNDLSSYFDYLATFYTFSIKSGFHDDDSLEFLLTDSVPSDK